NEISEPRWVVRELSERINWAIRRAINSDPENRPANCLEFAEELTGKTTRVPPAPNADAPWYLSYTEPDGSVCMRSGDLQSVRQAIDQAKENTRQAMRIARSRTGPFALLDLSPEFAGSRASSPAAPPAQPQAAPPVPAQPEKVETRPAAATPA